MADNLELFLGDGTTLDGLLALHRALTGREPTPDEIEEARAILDGAAPDLIA